MEIIGIKTPLIRPGDDLVGVILDSANGRKNLKEKDILVMASSVVSTSQKRIQKINEVEPSRQAKELADKSGLDERFVEIIIREADEVLGPSEKCILTIKDGMLRINAGVDRTNVLPGNALLIPKDPNGTAEMLRKKFEEETGKKLGLIISDSHVLPLRLGTTGQAIGSSGIKEAIDCRDQKDLYGRRLQITFRGIGDQLAAAAQLVTGEADESIPAVIIRGAEAAFSDRPGKPLKVSPEKCVYSQLFGFKS